MVNIRNVVTIGIHLPPKKRRTKSGSNKKITTLKGKEREIVASTVLKNPSCNLEILSYNFEYAGKVTWEIT